MKVGIVDPAAKDAVADYQILPVTEDGTSYAIWNARYNSWDPEWRNWVERVFIQSLMNVNDLLDTKVKHPQRGPILHEPTYTTYYVIHASQIFDVTSKELFSYFSNFSNCNVEGDSKCELLESDLSEYTIGVTRRFYHLDSKGKVGYTMDQQLIGLDFREDSYSMSFKQTHSTLPIEDYTKTLRIFSIKDVQSMVWVQSLFKVKTKDKKKEKEIALDLARVITKNIEQIKKHIEKRN
jgi:hypothetical protein